MSLDSYIGGVEGINVGSYDLNDATNKSLEGSHSGSSLIDQLLSDSESNQASDNASNDVDDEEDDEDTEDNADENEDENADEDEDNDDENAAADEEEDESGDENADENEMEFDEGSNLEDKPIAEDEIAKLAEFGSPDMASGADVQQTDIQQADDEASNTEQAPSKTRKRKRKKAAAEGGGEKKKKKKSKKSTKPGNLRRNIREIMKDDELDADTLVAQKEEAERRRRLLEVKKALEQKMKEREEKDSQLKSLLQSEETKGEDVILLDSSDEGRQRPRSRDNDIIELSSDEEDDEDDDDEDDVTITKEDEDIDAESEDPNNAGSHINDELNVPDDEGRILVNIGHSSEEEDIYLAPQIAKFIKRHQIGGVRFLYDNLIESINRYNSSPGFGCILAHSMGLGKTIQMISFIDIFLRFAKAKTVLLIVPINTLQNWMAEFNMWCPPKEVVGEGNSEVIPRNFGVFLLNENYKTTSARAKVIDKWYKEGGVLLMGYEMYRLLSSRRGHIADKVKKPGRKPANPVVIDVEEEYKNKGLLIGVHEALINPGPDLIVCDEGHRIKNSQAGISQSLKNIKTKRRVVLTGYPLQNNLMEYWCMVDFVRPNYLGTKTEFSNMFERPITNGQCHDSTQGDEKLMRYRAHVLHSLLEGFVQRRGHTVLRDALPPKQEFIFMIRMSPIQKKLYKEFMDSLMGAGLGTWASNNPLKAFAVCCKIWNHPDILHNLLNKRNAGTDDNDLDIETEGGPAKKPKAPKKPRVPQPVDAYYPPNDRNQEINYDWAKDLMKDYMSGLLEQGGKMVILMKLIEESLACNDKILVFSQSLFTLDLIEEFLSKYKVPRPDMDENWAKNRSYFRLDGSTSAQEREKLINQFNAPDNNRCWLFLLSTRAGSLGVNLVGANRVVVVDASWNPCHDCQAICRIYRFGQVKPCFIYRLVTDNTMEKKIYDRQVTKQGMSNRVVDEMQVQSHFSRRQVDNLLQFEDQDFDEVDFSGAEEEYIDPVMINVLQKEGKWLTKKPFEHESLLIDKKELRLTKKEKAIAKQSYVMEKRLNVSYTRPSYAAFYPKGTEPMRRPQIKIVNPTNMSNWPSFPGRPVASVKPMISTPVPMQIKRDGTAAGIMVSKNKPGVSVHKVVTTTDIMLPGTSTSTQAGVTKSEPNKIPAGQQIFIIKTPKGVYIRTAAGKIFAVRAKFPLLGTLGAGTAVTTSTTSTVTTAEVNTATTSSISSSASASSPSSSSWEPGSEPKTITSTATTTLTSSVVTDASKRKDADSFLSSALDKPSNSVKKQDSSNSLVSMSTNVTCSTTDSIRRQDSTASLISGLNKVTDSFRREDSSSSLASTLNAADILGDKESDEDSKSNEINFPSSDSLLDLDSKSVKKAASKGKPKSDRTLNQEKEMASIEPKSTNMEMSAADSEMKSANTEMNFTNTEMNFANKEINLANTEMNPTNTELNSMNEMPMEMASKVEDVQSRYQKIAPNLASFGAQMGMDNNQMMQAPNNIGSHNEMPMNDRYQTKNMESFSAQLGLHNDQGMPQNYNNYGPPMGGANDMMQNNPYQMPSMNHNNMMSLPYLYQNQMIYNPPPPYPSGANNQSPYGNSGGYSDQMGGMPQNQMRDNINTSMQNNSMQNTSMPNSSMQNMGMPGMASMGMPMQHSMLGFPFAPYPFPMPQPYLMGGMDRSYMSHMQMGQGGGYMPQGMGHMPQSHMGMGMPQQNTMNISNFQHGNGGSVSSVSNTTNMPDNTGNQ